MRCAKCGGKVGSIPMKNIDGGDNRASLKIDLSNAKYLKED